MDEKFEKALLYDFYGEMLNEHQSRIYEDIVFNDLYLGEIAFEEGISRQGVSDMMKRCTKKLEAYEEKLHLVSRFLSIKKEIESISELTERFKKTHDESIMNDIERISNQILEEL